MSANKRSILAVVTVVLAIGGCKSTVAGSGSSGSSGSGGSSAGTSAGSAGSGPDARSIDPLANQDGLKPGLAPISSADEKSQALDLIGKLTAAAPGPKTGYTREKFGDAWTDKATGVPLSGNGCDTRDDILARDGQKLTYSSGSKCTLASMTLYDPYKADTIEWTKAKATTVQIDHVVPLSYAWQMGASKWSDSQRTQLANDPLNLLAVDGPDNSAKGDSGPAEWLPPNSGIYCAYAVRFTEVALKYKLSVADQDKAKMLTLCKG